MSIGGPRESWIDPVVLEGELVRLVPLRADHAADLWKVGQHEDLWRWMPWTLDTERDFEELVASIVAWAETCFGQGYVTEVRDGTGHGEGLRRAGRQHRRLGRDLLRPGLRDRSPGR